MHRRSYRSSVLPTVTTSAGGVRLSSLYTENSDVPGGVFSSHGSAFVPLPLDMIRRHGLSIFQIIRSESDNSPSVANFRERIPHLGEASIGRGVTFNRKLRG